ncbi:MAG: hypothetical protein ACUZ8I_07815 [Candidatus Scalindua sp.]
MADIYLRSGDGDNADDGSTWDLAKKTLEDNGMSSTGTGAILAAGAGGRVFMSSDHAQIEAVNITVIVGTINSPLQILSVDDTQPEGSEVLKAGGSVSVGNLTQRGYMYSHGVTFLIGGTYFISSAESRIIMEDVTMNVTPTNGKLSIGSGGFDIELILINSTINFSFSNQNIQVKNGAKFQWFGGSLTGTALTALFKNFDRSGFIHMRNIDMSGQSGSLLTPISSEQFIDILLERCKLHASLTILSTAITGTAAYRVRLHSCDSANTTYNFIEEHYEGTIIDETTIVRTGGQSDGTTPLSLKMTTNANAIEFLQPLVSPPLSTRKIKILGLKTLTVEFIHDSLINLQNDEIWMEAEDSTGATVQGRITNDKMTSILGTPADQPSSTATWDTSGLTNPNTQKLSVDITLLKLGPITLRVYLAKPSTTAYLDWKVVVS